MKKFPMIDGLNTPFQKTKFPKSYRPLTFQSNFATLKKIRNVRRISN